MESVSSGCGHTWPFRSLTDLRSPPSDHAAGGPLWTGGTSCGLCWHYILLTTGGIYGEDYDISSNYNLFFFCYFNLAEYRLFDKHWGPHKSKFLKLCTVLTHTLSLEHVLVQPGLVPDLLHPQHHLIDQTSQVLPENEVHWRLWVSATHWELQTCSSWFIYMHSVHQCAHMIFGGFTFGHF